MPIIVKVQGVELDVSVANWEPVRLGAVGRSFSGALRSSVRDTKRTHRVEGDQAGVPVALAEAIRALVEGEGHSWSFDNPANLLVSSRGLLPYSTGTVSDASGKYGNAAQFDEGEPSTKWDVRFNNAQSTIMYWRKEEGEWFHYAVVRDVSSPPAVWRNEFQTDDDPNSVYSEDGLLVVDPNINPGSTYLDDLVYLPFALPVEWVLQVYALRATQQWKPLPYVVASGDAFPAGEITALGQGDAARRVPLGVEGVFALGELVSFSLEES